MSHKLLLVFAFFLSCSMGYSQNPEKVKPNRVELSSSMRTVQPLSLKKALIPAKNQSGEVKDARSSRNKVIIGKGSTGNDNLVSLVNDLTNTIPGNTPSPVFDTTEQSAQPTDPSLALGPNHVLAVFNTGYRIFDKDGNALTGNLSPDNIFSPGSCCDLTISYDRAADRWVMSILYASDGHVEVAVSQGPDPVNDAWSVYSFANVQDYQKLSVWSDGYYMTANANSASAATADVIFVFDRDAMLAGEATATLITFPLPGIVTGGFYSPQAFNVTNGDFPSQGNSYITYFQDDAWNGINDDHIKIWEMNVDFSNPNSSTITNSPQELITTDFISVFDGGSFANLTQPNGGQDIDALQGIVMNQAQFRKFNTHNSVVLNFVVDTDGSAGELAGVRWYELRQSADGQPWSIYQEGTYLSPNGKHAWNASMIMDGDGNIAMGYTGMGGTTNTVVSSYYTGRFANDPLGIMTFDETLIAPGGGNIPGGDRYGDYSKIDIDPGTDDTFWFVNEYVNADGNRANVAGAFKLVSGLTNDVTPVAVNIDDEGVFSSTETIIATIYNLGSTEVSNFNVSYQINGGTVVTETFTGTILPYQNADITFAQTADLSAEGQYVLTISTSLSGDELTSNDDFSKTILHTFADEIGIAEITSPNSGLNLNDEQVIIKIENFGRNSQSGFDVSYNLDGGSPVVETVAGPLQPGESLDYTFAQTVNLSGSERYTIEASTLLNDGLASNNILSKQVDNFICDDQITNNNPVAIDESGPNTITSEIQSSIDVVITSVLVEVNIEHTWASDLTIKLIAPDNTEVLLSNRRGADGDNFTNTTFDDSAAQSISEGAAPFTGSFRPETPFADLVGKSSLGTWTLSIEDGFSQDGGQLVDWTLSFCTVPSLSITENLDPNNDLKIIYKDNNRFDIRFDSDSVNEQLELDVFNLNGQRLLNYRLNKENGIGYYYDLDMSYASSGVYMVRIKDKQNRAKVKKLVVR